MEASVIIDNYRRSATYLESSRVGGIMEAAVIIAIIVFAFIFVFLPDVVQAIRVFVLRFSSYEYLEETAQFGKFGEPLNDEAWELTRRNDVDA